MVLGESMKKHASKRAELPERLPRDSHRLLWGTALFAVCLWAVSATATSSRIHLVMGYTTIPAGPSWLEPFMASDASWLLVALFTAIWLFQLGRVAKLSSSRAWQAVLTMVVANVSTLAFLTRIFGSELPPSYWEPLWLSAWAGSSMALLAYETQPVDRARLSWPWSLACTCVLVTLFAGWWYQQSLAYYQNYLLGFNDFGHFAQRIANTAEGRGLLLESPVLPAFWDHFNPGLLVFVPLWKMYPNVNLFFAVQAISLAVGALLIWLMAKRLKFRPRDGAWMAAAWLVQPALGQMNVAYTYGWHPISLAIPLLLLALWALLAENRWLAVVASILAMSMEEGVIVIVCLFCANNVWLCLWPSVWSRRNSLDPTSNFQTGASGLAADRAQTRRIFGVGPLVWSAAALASGIGFLLVYQFSGIAEFQTGRFVALGNSATEVVLSPLLRPSAFWGQIFRWDKLAFCLSLWLPCFAFSLWHGWRWLLPTALPLLLLVVWDHKPAASLAFQYSATLLPLFWFATLHGAAGQTTATAVGALSTGLLLSLYMGQLPYSSPTLLDVEGRTYGTQSQWRRQSAEEDGRWLDDQVRTIHQDGSAVLATGRIAAHLVGNRDVETVGQYVQRREELATLSDRMGAPIKHYRWIVLDRQEAFQQSQDDIATVQAEALQAGFVEVTQRYGVLILQRVELQ